MKRWFLGSMALLAVVLVAGLSMPAFAAGTVNLQPAVAGGVEIVLAAGVTIATTLLGVFVKGAQEQRLRQSVQTALEAAAAYAVVKVKNADWAKLDVKSPLVAAGVNYMFNHVPKALKFFGITPEKLSNELAEKVLARLAHHAPLQE